VDFYYKYPLVPKNGTTVTWVKITYMPSLADGFGDSTTNPGDYFFSYFNSQWALESLPEWSFDTSIITTVGNGFFNRFNQNWALIRLPEYSFNIENITTVGNDFFSYFNSQWALESLPEWSFDTSKITSTKDGFFALFNRKWSLMDLPDESFNTSNITEVWSDFFAGFNSNSKIKSLPDESFDTSNITTVGDYFFYQFNRAWGLTSLPTWSFDISKITIAKNYFFMNFNSEWALTGLPTWSFDTSHIISVKSSFFSSFNQSWALESLPEWSFDTSNITTAGSHFFYYFNQNWKITNLPDSFKITSGWVSSSYGYWHAFNSPNYTLNRSVSELVSWVSAPSNKRYTFSDNQPWRCGAHSNWLVNPGNACNIIYDANGWTWTITWWYVSNATWVAAWTWIKLPTKEWYALSEWRDISWNRVDEVIFPDMDGETLYAQWEECDSWYVVNSTWTLCVLKEYTITYNLWWWYLEDRTWNKYEWNQVVTYTYSSIGNKYVANIEREYVKRENSTFLGWYSSWWELFDFWTISPEKNMAFAKYECDFWYIENESSTACERIRVDFDANWWNFSGNSDIYSIIKSKQVIRKKAEVHTANLDDNDNYTNEFNWQLMNGYTTSIAPYTSWWITTYSIYSPTIVYFEKENVEKFDVSIKYWWGPYCNDIWYIIVWTWNHIQFDQNYNPNNTGLSLLYIDDFPSFWKNSEKSVEIEGNSFTIFQNNWCPSYWFFANISWTWVDFIYEENAFDNIPEPTREWHKFVWWYLSDGTEFNAWTVSTWEVTHVYAKWECADGYENKWWECVKKSSWSSGWWGGWGWWGSSSKTDTGSASSQTWNQINSNTWDIASTWTNVKEPETNTGSNIQTWIQVDSSEQTTQNDESNIQDSSNSSQNDGKTYSAEFQEAYEFAKWNGITTMPTIQKANMEWKLTRIAMAKMLSQYAINVLWKTPDTSKTIKFKDVTSKKDADYDNWVTLAYQLWIMWQNMPNNRFRPNDEVSRAEFVTALSRLLYQTTDGEYKSTSKYYTPHMAKLYNEWIINNTDPSMKERRWYVMIMLMRSVK